MTSIRDHTGSVYACGTCGQPCLEGEFGPEHFTEQWDGVFCPWFPLAGQLLEVQWDDASLSDLRDKYPDTYPRVAPTGAPVRPRTF